MQPVSAAQSFAHEREPDRAYLANHSFSISGPNVFRSIRRELLLGSFVLALWAAIIPAYAQGQLKDGQRITVPDGSRLRSELTIAVAGAREVERTLQLSGAVQADPARNVKVLPPTAGRVVDVKVQAGDRVSPQQELAVIYVAGLRRTRLHTPEAQPMPISADAPIGEGQIGLQRADDDLGELSAAQLRALSAPVDGPRNNRLLSLRAPVAGSITQLRMKLGDRVSPSGPMATIANLDAIWVTMSVPTNDAAFLVGQPVQLRFIAYPGEDFTGEARLVGSAPDASALTTKLRIAVENPNTRLKPNMSASVQFLGLKENVPIIPVAALVSNQSMVFVEIAPWVFEARAVRLHRLEDGQAVVASGVKIGDRVAMPGRALLLARQPE
jgi:cobalt-zinc-cadmium efflux system membrane fusion protein